MIRTLGTFALAVLGPQPHAPDTLRKMRLRRYRERRKTRVRTGGSRREAAVRGVLRSLTPGVSWDPARPKWLMGEHRRPLEIDCWAPELGPSGIAVEVNGPHHTSACFVGTEKYEKQKRRDDLKRGMLLQRGTPLIEVPWGVPGTELDAWLCIRLHEALR